MNLQQRRDATVGTVERFGPHPFDWDKWNCGKMLIWHLRAMGHRPLIGPGGTWRNEIGLMRFLRRHGGSGGACLDGWALPRIAPAYVLVGDIVEIVSPSPFGCFGVALDNGRGRVFGYHEDFAGPTALAPKADEIVAVWRA